jgi:hypothetical protein
MGQSKKVDFDKLHAEDMASGNPVINPLTGKPGYEGVVHNHEVYEDVSTDGLRHTFSRGAALTPEGHKQRAYEREAYERNFGGGYAENSKRKTKQSFMERLIFGRDS